MKINSFGSHLDGISNNIEDNNQANPKVEGDCVLIQEKEQLENNFLLNIDNGISGIKARLIEIINIDFPDIENFLEYEVLGGSGVDSRQFEELLSKVYVLYEKYENDIKDKLKKLNNEFEVQKNDIQNQGIFLFENRDELLDSIDLNKLFNNIEEIVLGIQNFTNQFINDYYGAIEFGTDPKRLVSGFSELKEKFTILGKYLEDVDIKNNSLPF